MASYHVWHPAYLPGRAVLEMFVTRGNAYFLSRGTPALVSAALRAVGVSAPADRVSFEAMRTH
jgi:hypothetical protein